MFYAGIGSRKTPPEILSFMTECARFLDYKGFILRSGGAGGAESADLAFEAGATNKEIFIPWEGFNNRGWHDYKVFALATMDPFKVTKAREITSSFHPNWDACSRAARDLHTRNAFQVLGPDLETPSSFVACWTPNGKSGGGTGQAIRIANHYSIPVYDFAIAENLVRFRTFMESL